MHYLGVDGGGTETVFALMDENEEIIKSHTGDGCYYPDIGKDGVAKVLREGMERCLEGIVPSNVVACAGIPSYGERDSLMEDLDYIKSKLPVRTLFTNDVEVGYYGSLGFTAGINVVAGTGSIAIGFDESGNCARAGGFGPAMNCDEGSGHHIGLALIQKFTRQSDMREERTLLYNIVRQELQLNKDMDILSRMTEDIRMDRAEVAKLSILAHKIALQGDEACISIFNNAARELYLLAAGVRRQLEYKQTPIKVSYSGGVFKAGELIFTPFEKLLSKNGFKLVKPAGTPVYGACLQAGKMARAQSIW